MNTLIIPLAHITEDGCRIDTTVDVMACAPKGAPTLAVEAVQLTGMLTPVSSEYLFRGRIHGVFLHACDRCLQPARTSFDIEVTWDFQEGAARTVLDEAAMPEEAEYEYDTDVASPETYMYQGLEIDLGPCVYDEVSLAAPAKYVCREDCAGLCSRCGANLNEGPCSCAAEDEDTISANKGLAGLAELFPDLAPKKEKE